MNQENYKKYQRALRNKIKSIEYHYTHLDIDDELLIGVKNTVALKPMVQQLEKYHYKLHTIDSMATNGRAIDINLVNPLTGRLMTGSSSGTAINVMLGINDIGIGTDGGGSVLGPAMCLNLYGFIDQRFPRDVTRNISTDGISFKASAGLITRDAKTLIDAVKCFDFRIFEKKLRICIPSIESRTILGLNIHDYLIEYLNQINCEICVESYPNVASDREGLIVWLKRLIEIYDVVLNIEGPIDYLSYGDSIQGSFSEYTSNLQRLSGKGLLRVANMANASALVIPIDEISSGIICISKDGDKALQMLSVFKYEPTELIQRYFHNQDVNKFKPFKYNNEEDLK